MRGGELAKAQIDRGADVIYHAAGGTGLGVLQAAADAARESMRLIEATSVRQSRPLPQRLAAATLLALPAAAQVNFDAQPTGFLTAGTGGFPADAWNGTSMATAKNLVSALPAAPRAVDLAVVSASWTPEDHGTSALNASNGFTRAAPTAVVVVGYGLAFYFLALTLKTVPVAIAYAIWSGVGVALITAIGWVFFRQALDAAAMVGIALIVAGVLLLINIFLGSFIFFYPDVVSGQDLPVTGGLAAVCVFVVLLTKLMTRDSDVRGQRIQGAFLGLGAVLYLVPYILGQGAFDSTGLSPLTPERDYDFKAGIDARYRITSNLTLTAAINPDFGQVEVDPARRHQDRRRLRRSHRQRQRRHRHAMRVVRMDDVRTQPADDAREAPRRREVHLGAWCERDEVGALGCAFAQLTLRVDDECGAVAESAQPVDGEQHLVLPTAPAACGVDVEREHARPAHAAGRLDCRCSSHSFANLRNT